jgi:TonB family protein
VEPPVRVDTERVPYPPGATGDRSVVLELRIDRQGGVAQADVVEGEEPFARAAREAAMSWRFEPARRDGVPVEARIRVRIDFTQAAPQPVTPAETPGAAPPPAQPVKPSPPPTPAAPASAAPAEAGAMEVTVHGVRPEPGRQEMSGGEVRQLPGAFGDAFRAIEALPGVIPLVSGLPYFLVRGAPPGNTGFYIDGVRVPALFHLGVGAAVVHPGLVDRVNFYPGGYPARFGRFTGGILSGEVLPTPERPHIEASVRLLDAGALAATPFADGRGDVLVSGRYGYPGFLLSLFAPDVGLAYWDYQTRLRWRTERGDELGAFIFGSFDSLSVRDQNTRQMVQILGLQFHRADLRWDRATSPTGHLRVALTLGYERSSASNGPTTSVADSGTSVTNNGPGPITTTNSSPSNEAFIEDETVALRADWTERAGPDADVRVGGEAIVAPYRVVVPDQSPVGGAAGSNLGGSSPAFFQTDLDAGLYGELVWRPSSRVELRPGLRIDTFTSFYPGSGTFFGVTANHTVGPVLALDPRLAARWDITPALSWIVALGVAHQASNIPLPSPGLQFSELWRGLQSAYQYSTGAEVKLPAKFTATGDVFMHDYTGLADLYETCPANESTCSFDGRSAGLELMVKRPLTERFTGWLSYTLSRTERQSFYLGSWYRRVSEFDRPHVANLVLAADLGRRWRAGARLLAYSGLPYNSVTGMVGPPDSRGPPFFRVDLRVEKKWNAMGGTLTLVFEWLNALLNKEAVGTVCMQSYGGRGGISSQCQPNLVGPITFPSVGLEAAW